MRMRTAWLLTALLAAALPALAAKPPKVQWLKMFWGLKEASGSWVRQTSDGGYIAAGVTDVDSWPVPCRYYVVRLNSAGDTLWTRTFVRPGNYANAVAHSVVQTMDGGFAVFGTADSEGLTQSHLVKLDSTGGLQWRTTFHGDTFADGSALQQTADSGYVLAGHFYWSYPYLHKVDKRGEPQWCWAVEDDRRDVYQASAPVALAGDGGYVTTGHSDSFGLTLWKVNSAGITVWRQVYADEDAYDCQSLVPTADQGFAVVGITGKSGSGDPYRFYLLKVNASGIKEWCKYFSGRNYRISSVWQTKDSGFIMAGSVSSTKGRNWKSDAFVLRTDRNGKELWYALVSPPSDGSGGGTVQQTSDGGYIICGGAGWRLGNDRVHGCMFLTKLAPDQKTGPK